MSDRPRPKSPAALDQRIVTSTRRPVVIDDADVPRRDVTLPGTVRRMSIVPIDRQSAEQERDALPPPPGYCYTLDGRLVPLEDVQQDITDTTAQAIFCEVLEITGSLRAACDALGIVSMHRVRAYMTRDPDFADAAEAAADRHRQSLYAHAVRRATVGYQVPIIGGKEKDEIVGYETRMSDTLLALLLKRHFPEFRETKASPASVTVNVNQELPDFKKMPRDKRAAMRLLLEESSPDVVDAEATEGEPIREAVEDNMTKNEDN